MDIVPYDQFLNTVCSIEESYVQKLKSGFAPNSFCDIVKEMFASMCLHFIENEELFDDERKIAINNIINTITNG